MKRLICALMALVLAAGVCGAGAEDLMSYLPTDELTNYLPIEKLLAQLAVDSFEMAVRVRAEGEGDWAKQIEPLKGKEFRMFFLRKGNRFNATLYRYDEGRRFGESQMYADGENVYLRSEFLMDTVLKLPQRQDVYTSLTQMDNPGNPALLSFLVRLMLVPFSRWESRWDTALAPVRRELEVAMSRYAAEPRVVTEDGVSLVLMSYRLSADQIRAEAAALLAAILNSDDLRSLLSLQMTGEQASSYLKPEMLWYYNRELAKLPLSGEILIERRVSLQGAELSTAMTLPLPQSLGFDTARIESAGEAVRIKLASAEQTLTLVSRTAERSAAGSRYEGDLFLRNAVGGEMLAVTYQAVSTVTESVDDSKQNHLVTDWKINVTEKKEISSECVSFEPIQAHFVVDLFSQNGISTRSTVTFQSLFTLPGGKLWVTVKLVTVDPEEPEPFGTEGATDLAALSPEQRETCLRDFWLNALLALTADNRAQESSQTMEIPLPAEETPQEETEEPAGGETPAEENPLSETETPGDEGGEEK